jgi:hypothetical protein
MKGAIASIVFSKDYYNFNDESIKNNFLENINKFPLDKLEEYIKKQNSNLDLISCKDVINDLKNQKENNDFQLVKFNPVMGFLFASPKGYKLISDSYYNILQSTPFIGISDIRTSFKNEDLIDYFNKIDVDTLLLVHINIKSNYYANLNLSSATPSGFQNQHVKVSSGNFFLNISITAIDKNLKVVGSSLMCKSIPVYKGKDNEFDKEFIGKAILIENCFISSSLDTRDSDFIDLLGIPTTMKDTIEKEIIKNNLFFNEFYNNFVVVDKYPVIQNESSQYEVILRGINLNISFPSKELRREREWVFNFRHITIN